ncbi:Laminin subunit alpha-3 [Dissostichus eleginoides]|uniref:Laminin subunit alpha-3 n=1 Tax=Dissostichus eleginoides TaxID=100907 RepID=A0AAD9C836_DISEL|nr:Laminin subunit alpha-3 [Dissostichus eleginoides]
MPFHMEQFCAGLSGLCRHGYSGDRCERCAFGYFGNPMVHGSSCKPCNCKGICDSLTGECIASDNSSSGAHCHECDSCNVSLLLDLETLDDVLALMKQQLQNVTDGPASISWPIDLQDNISETGIQWMQNRVWRYSTAGRHLVEQLEADVDSVRDKLSQLTDKKLKAVSDLEKVVQNVNETKSKEEDLLAAIEDLLKQQTDVKPREAATLSENSKARMMEEAQRIMQEMRDKGCTAQRDRDGREQEDVHKLSATDQAVLNLTAESLMVSDSALREMAELLSDAEDRVHTTQALNRRGRNAVKHLEHLQSQLGKNKEAPSCDRNN